MTKILRIILALIVATAMTKSDALARGFGGFHGGGGFGGFHGGGFGGGGFGGRGGFGGGGFRRVDAKGTSVEVLAARAREALAAIAGAALIRAATAAEIGRR